MINNTRNLSKATVAKDIKDRLDNPVGVSVENTKDFTDIKDVTPATTDNYYQSILNPTKPKTNKEGDIIPDKGTSNSPLSVFSAMAEISPDLNNIQTAQSRPFDYTKYGEGTGENLGVVHTDSQMNKGRAEDQSGWVQAKNAIGRVALNIVPEIVSQVANVLDVEDYANTDAEVGNWLNTAMQNVEKDVNEALPIYRENPDTPLDYKDSAWWFENGSELVKSAGAFAAVGFATAGAVAPLFAEAGFMAKFLNPNSLRVGTALTTATALNQAEGVGIATDTFKQSYDQELLKMQSGVDGAIMSPEEMDIKARTIASEKATSALNFNKINILLNITSAGLFMNAPTSINALAKQATLKNTLKHIASEGGQEYLEETINDISTNQALADDYSFADALEYAGTSKGIESGLLGFIGGAAQTGASIALKHVPIKTNTVYNKAYSEAYNKVNDPNITEEEKSSIASKEALDKVGTNKAKVSANWLNNQRYIQQQKELLQYNLMSNSDKISDVTTAFDNTQETTKLQKEIALSRKANDNVKADELEKRLFNQQAYQSFETGTVDGFTELYKGYRDLSHEEASARSIYKEGDETKPIYYKKKAQEAIDTIDALGKIYLDSSNYINNHQVYDLQEQQYSTKKTIENNKSKLNALVKQAESDYKHVEGIKLGEGENNYVDPKNVSGYNVNNFPVKFKFTSAYKQIKSLSKSIQNLQENVNNLQETTNIVTSSEFQNELSKKIRDSIKSDEKEKKQQQVREKVINSKLENKGLQTNLESQVLNTVEEVQEQTTDESLTTLPVNESVGESTTVNEVLPVSVPETKQTKTKPKSIQSVTFPKFNDPGLDGMLSGLSNRLGSYDYYEEDKINEAQGIYDTLNAGKEQFLTSFPLKANEINSTLETLEQSIQTAKSNIDSNIQDKIVAKENAQALMSSFQDLPVDGSLEQSNSPSISPNFEKADQQYQLLKTVLQDAFNQGIDNTEGEDEYFKNIVNYLQDLTSKDQVVEYFIPLKNLFNVVTGSNIEGSYQELMLSPLEKQETLNTLNKIALFSVPTGTYTFDMDNISANLLSQLNEIAKMQGVNAEDNGMAFTVYNETASNLLAYLVKDYNVKFTPKKDKNGNPYVEVTKEDVSNLLNKMLDQRVLNPEILKAGKIVEFRALESVTLEDGSLLYAKDVDYGNKPIGVFMDGSQVEGLYLHDPSWIDVTNVDNTKAGIESDRAKLLALKTYIVDNPNIIHTTTIINRSPGVPILDSTGQVESVGSRMPNVQVGLIQNGQVRLNRNEVANVLPNNISEGKSVIVIPFGSGQLALPTKRAKLNNTYKDSILSALDLYLKGKQTSVTNELKSKYGIDILGAIGLEQYMNMFINLGKLNAKTITEYTLALNTLNDGVVLTQFSNVKGIGTQLLFGEGSGIDSGYISKAKYINNEGDIVEDLAHFKTHLDKLFTHVNLDLLGTDTVVPIINGNEIVTEFSNYDGFVKNLMLTPYLALTLEDSSTVYSIQGKINFDLDAIYDNKPREIDNVSYETPNEVVVEEEQQFTPFTTPDGRIIDFNDMDEDFSPNVDQIESNIQYSAGGKVLDIDALEKASFSIKGIPLSTQISLIRTISNSVQTEILENPASSFNVAKQVDLFMQGLQLTKEEAIRQGHPKSNIITEQVDILTQKDNIKVITDEVRTSLSKKKNVKVASDNSEDIEIEAGEENDKSFEAEFTVDPKVGMTDTIRLWFEGFTEKKVVKGQLRERTNLLGLKAFIPFDESYNDVLGLLAKSNNNTGYITTDVVLNRKFDTSDKVQPVYITNILNKLEEHVEDKPYFLDVITKLRYAEPHIQNQFNSTFNVTHTNHIFLQDSYDATEKIRQLKPISSSARNVTNLVISEWQNSLKNTGFFTVDKEKVEVNKDVLKRFKDTYSDVVNKKINITEDLLNNWLQPIGIVFPPAFYTRLDTKGLKQNDVVYSLEEMFTLPNGIFKNIYNRVNKFDVETPNALSLEDSNLYDDSSFKELGNLLSYYRKDLFNKAFKNGNGDTVNGFTNAKRVIEQGLKLKSNLQTLLDLKKDVFSENSTWLNTLLSTNQQEINKESLFYKYFNYFTVDSFKLKKNQKGKVVDTLKEKELERLSLGLFYNQGLSIGKTGTKIPIHKFLFNTMSDKAAVIGYQAPGRHYTFNQILDNLGIVQREEMYDKDKEYLVKTLFFPEITRIIKFQDSIGTSNEVNIAEYAQGAGKFLLFPELNNIHSLFEGREVDADGNIIEQGLLKDAVLTDPIHMVALKEAVYNHVMSEYQIKEDLWKKFDIISVRNNESRLQYVDNTYQKAFPDSTYKNTLFNYVVNYMVANMNFQQLFIGDIALYTKGNALSTSDNLGKRLASMSAGQTPYNNYNEKFNVLVVSDDVQKSTAFNYIQDTLIKIHGEKKGRELAKGYESLKASDAQEYTSLSEHINLMFAEGKISENIKNQVIEYYERTGDILTEYKTVLNPTKPVYTNNFRREGINSSLYIKSSSIPLIKSLTQGTELDKFRQILDNKDNNIQRIAFKTAVKIGQPKSVINPFKEDGRVEFPTDFEHSVIRNIPRDGHGVQQAVPYDSDNNIVNDGTQQAKEWLTNFMDVKGFVNPITGDNVNGRELNKTYTDLYSKLFTMKHSALVRELAFDINTGHIGNLARLKSIIIKEGLSRNYNSNDVQSMELNDIEDKFTVPLWLNNSDSKIVSLLNSIVDNRVRKRKFRGKSLVLASNTGLQTIEKFKGNGIMTIPGFDGKPKATYNSDGKMVSAEVIIPFKFWDNKGKALNVNNFITNSEINLEKLPEELLEIFSYRIPTSGVNLMSNIKVVGFLPQGYGDIVIAPADFIEQMGSDFDVDKLYTHMYNTYYDNNTGQLTKLNQSHIDRFTNIKTSIKKLNDRIKVLEDNGIKSIEDNRLAYELRRRVTDLRNGTISTLENPEEQLIQNHLLDLHKSVLNNTDIDVQSARMKPLSFGDLPKLAKDFSKGLNTNNFTVLNDSYQKAKYLSARSGKSAVGNFSLNMVFNSVVQQVEEPMNFMDGDNRIVFNIGGQQSNYINDIKSINGSKYKSDVIEAFMAASLDNENEQLLGKLNINNETFDFIRVAVQLGYDENTVLTLINQPIIKDYVEKVGLNIPVKSVAFDDRQKLDIKTLNIEDLKENINTDVIDTNDQKSILSFFLILSLKGKELKTLQSAINSDSSGIGKNMFYSMRKSEQILNLPTKTSISYAHKLIGDYIYLDSNVEYNSLSAFQGKLWLKEKIKEGYYKQGQTLIKPNTLGGLAGVYGTVFNTQLWSQLYPYTDSDLYSIITSVQQDKQDRKESINEESKELQESVTNYKSLLISNAFDLAGKYNNINEARQSLLFDSITHMSLGSIVSDLRVNNIYTNPFLDRLQIGRSSTGIDVTGKVPTDINYYNASSNEYDEEILLKTVIDMITNPKPLGEYNGESLDTRGLMEKLATHQFITGGIQKSSQFVKYIPFEYLKQIGYYDDLKVNSRLGQSYTGVKAMKDVYRTQMVQHFPESYYNPNLENDGHIITDGMLLPFDKLYQDIVVLKDKNSDKFLIFKQDPVSLDYLQIDNLGSNGLMEWDINSNFAGKSNIWLNQVEERVEPSIYTVPEVEQYIPIENDEIANFLTIDRSTLQDITPNVYNRETKTLIQKYGLDDTSISITSKYTGILDQVINTNSNPITVQFAKELLQVVDIISETPLYINTRLDARASTFTTQITGEPVRIEINPTKIKSDLDLQNILIEEMTHAVLKQELLKEDSNFVKNINDIRFDIINSFTNEEYEEFKEMSKKVKNKLPLKKGKEKEFYYNLLNNDEFITGAIKDISFQQYLNNQEGTYTTKSLWSKFIDSIKNLLVKLGVKDNSTLGAVIDNTLSLFKSIDKSLSKSLITPKYTRTVEYINDKFNLTDDNGNILNKINSNEIAGFINSYIVNVTAKVNYNKVIVESNTIKDIVKDLSPDFNSNYDENEGMGGSLKIYLENIQDRINRLSNSITKAEQDHNTTRVAELTEQRNKETLRIDDIKDVISVAALSDKGREDLDLVNNIMNRPMTSEDINYTRSIVNFWRDARENVFLDKHKSSTVLTEMYGAIEGKADLMHDKLFGIEKTYLEEFIKQKFGKDASIDDIFAKYKDISWDRANLRDISQYDNLLLNSIWSAIKEANINALTEGEAKTEEFNVSLQKVLPILKSINPKSPFELFRQLTASGKKTTQLVKPFTHQFYKDRYKQYSNVLKNNNTIAINGYSSWVKNNGVDTKLSIVFPANGVITDEVSKTREDLRIQLGNGIYNQWYKNQERKLTKYEINKEGYINYLLGEYKLTKADDISNNSEALSRYQFWLTLNSPYTLNDVIHGDKTYSKDLVNYNSQNYYEVVPKDKNYLDSNYQTISNNDSLLEFYDLFNNLVTDLSYYVPESQQKIIAYGGIPSIEKSLFELYSDKGMELGFAPIYNRFVQSMQTSYNETSITATDFATGKPRQDMRIPVLKDNYRTIQDYVSAKEAEYIVRENKSPTAEILKGFEEDIVNQIAEETSFDLGKIAKVYSALVLAHKHKAKLQDTINIANNVMGSYGETILRPDGSPLTNRVTGQSEKKAEAESFIKTKQSFDSYIQNVMYGNVKEEEGKGKKIYTKTDKVTQKNLEDLLAKLEVDYQTGNMEPSLYESTRNELEGQLTSLGKTLIYSKVGDNILKYLQLKLMGWNVLGGVGNMGFGWIANTIEAAGGVHFNSSDLSYAYKLTGSSILKNWTFNKVETDTAKKIRSMMDIMDVLKDSSYELYTDSVKGELATKLSFLSPFNISQRSEYLNQAPLMIAMFRNTELETSKGKINLYDGFNNDGTWNTEEYGEIPTSLINKTRIKLDKLIVQVHGNYDNLSPIQAKRSFLGRAASQFRNFLFEAYYTRFETERFDPSLGVDVKGRYRSVGTVFSNTSKGKFTSEVLKGIVNQLTFNKFNIGDFNSLVNGKTIKEVDAVNMKKVAMEVALAIEVQLFLLLLTGFGKDDDDEDGVYNVLFNQGTRMRTDLLLYINPNEAKNIIKDLIPAMSVIKDTSDWISAVGSLIQGEDTIKAGVHEGNSKIGTATAKMIPFVAKVYSTYNSASQSFDKTN